MRDRLHDCHQIAGAMLQLPDEHALRFDVLFGVGNVLRESDSAHPVSIPRKESGARANPAHRAVAANDPEFVCAVLAVALGLRACGYDCCPVVRMDVCEPYGAARRDFADAVAEHAIQLIAPDMTAVSIVAFPGRHVSRLDGDAQTLLASAQRLVRQFSLGKRYGNLRIETRELAE